MSMPLQVLNDKVMCSHYLSTVRSTDWVKSEGRNDNPTVCCLRPKIQFGPGCPKLDIPSE
jgi:hypothetical protein